jgi:hypothetical protein
MVFSEEKTQKTFMSALVSPYPAMAWICTLAQNGKSFCFFFGRQKKSLSYLSAPAAKPSAEKK